MVTKDNQCSVGLFSVAQVVPVVPVALSAVVPVALSAVVPVALVAVVQVIITTQRRREHSRPPQLRYVQSVQNRSINIFPSALLDT